MNLIIFIRLAADLRVDGRCFSLTMADELRKDMHGI